MTETPPVKKKQPPAFSLTDTFNAFAAKALTDFPQLKDNFLLYSVYANTVHGSPGSKAAETAGIQRLKQSVEKYNKEKKEIYALALRTDNYYQIAYVNDNPERPQIDVIRTLDHELGHLAAPGGIYNYKGHGENFKECVADTFSALRALQSSPPDTHWLEGRARQRANDLIVKGATASLTTLALKELNILRQTHDCSKLTPVQTSNLAYRLSLQYSSSDEELQRCKEILSIPDKGATFWEKCAKVTLEDHGKDTDMIFKLGKAFLDPVLHHRLEVLGRTMPMEQARSYKFQGKFWDDIRAKINARDEQMKETPAQALAHKLDHLQALGYFDREPDKLIDPKQYESAENRAYIKHAREAYAAKLSAKPPAPPLPPPKKA